MKKLTGSLLLSLLCVTAVFASGFAFRSKADTGTAPSSVRIYGTVNQTSDGRLSISRQDGDFAGQELIIIPLRWILLKTARPSTPISARP